MLALAAVICFVIALFVHLTEPAGDYMAWLIGGLLALSLAFLWPWYPTGWPGPRR
jgi:hypothetical protein